MTITSRASSATTSQRTGQGLAPRIIATANPRDYRADDLARVRALAQRCLDFGHHVGFWIEGNWWLNNADAGADQLSWTDSFLDNRGAPVKHLVCGESACFMMQRIRVHAGQGDFHSDLYVHLAHATGSIFPDANQNNMLKWHVWVEITTGDENAVSLKVDLWGAGTGAGPLFPDGPPFDCIRTEVSNRFRLASRDVVSIGGPPGPTMVAPTNHHGHRHPKFQPPRDAWPLP